MAWLPPRRSFARSSAPYRDGPALREVRHCPSRRVGRPVIRLTMLRRQRYVPGGARSRVPSGRDIARFLSELRRPTRMSAARAVVDGAIVTWTLKKRGVRPLLSGIDPVRARVDADRSLRVAAAVDAGLGLVPVAPTCLRRSVLLVRELHRLGLAGSVHVGVRNVAGTVEAHAWVQSGGVVVNDDVGLTRTYVELADGDLEKLLPLLR